MIPKLSAPLVKDIRTGEGILEWVLAVLGVAAGATGNLSVAHTALYLAIVAAVKGARRGLLKLVALQKGVIGAPLEPQLLKSATAAVGELAPSVESVLGDIAAAEQAATKIQAAPGAPAETVAAGLAPDPAATKAAVKEAT